MEISEGRNNDSGALHTTITSSSGGGKFILVPGPKGIVKFLHQGFATTTHLGGVTILGFIQENFSLLHVLPFQEKSTP